MSGDQLIAVAAIVVPIVAANLWQASRTRALLAVLVERTDWTIRTLQRHLDDDAAHQATRPTRRHG